MNIKSLFQVLFKFAICCVFFSFSTANADTNLKNSFEPAEIKKISYVLASPIGNGQSSMGHSYLRLSKTDKLSSDDLMVEFLADWDQSNPSYLKALGLWSQYKRKVHLLSFAAASKEINIVENRDFFSYELKLSPQQISSIASETARMVSIGHDGNYSFINDNCASSVSKILRIAGLKIDSFDGNIPYKIPSLLREQNLITQTVMSDSASSRRKLLVNLNSELMKRIKNPFIDDIPSRLNSIDSMTRTTTVFYLQSALKDLAQEDAKRLRIFIYGYIAQETSIIKDEVVGNIAGEKLAMTFSKPQEVLLFQPKINNEKIQCNDGQCFLNITATGRSKHTNNSTAYSYKIKLPIKVLKNDLYLNDKRIGNYKSLKENGELIEPTFFGSQIFSEIKKLNDKDYLQTTLLMDIQALSAFNTININQYDILSLTNKYEHFPSCLSLVYLQKYLLENVVFAPELPRLSEKENESLILELLNGKIVIIPGFSSAAEFTASVNPLSLIEKIFAIHNERDRSLIGAISAILNSKEIKSEDFGYLQSLVRAGITLPVVFRVGHGNYGHAHLVTNIEDKGDYFELSGVDPNLRPQERFSKKLATFRKKDSMLITVGYGTVSMRLPELELNNTVTTYQLIKLHGGALKNIAKMTHQYAFTISDIVGIY